MTITIENTTRTVQVHTSLQWYGVQARIWEGRTESGIPVICAVISVAVADTERQVEFEKELTATRPPSTAACVAFPMRMVL